MRFIYEFEPCFLHSINWRVCLLQACALSKASTDVSSSAAIALARKSMIIHGLTPSDYAVEVSESQYDHEPAWWVLFVKKGLTGPDADIYFFVKKGNGEVIDDAVFHYPSLIRKGDIH